MKIIIFLIAAFLSFAIGCANKKTKQGRTIQVTAERNIISCRFIGAVSGSSKSDALEQAASWNGATHLVWTADAEGNVYSCD